MQLESNGNDSKSNSNLNQQQYQSCDVSVVPVLKNFETLPLAEQEINAGVNVCNSDEKREKVRTTQEVQTSFRPSIRESHE